MVCSRCRLLAPLGSDLFEPKTFAYRPDKACYLHNCTTKGRAPTVVPARFLLTCENGHLDDFPWLDFVHRGAGDCQGPLRLFEFGPSGEMADVQVKCDKCDSGRRMAEVVGPEGAKKMPACRGRRPHLRDFAPEGCSVGPMRATALGASNIWFPVGISALSVPQAVDELGRLIDENWAILEEAATVEVLAAFRKIGQLKDFVKYSDEQLWGGIQKKREGADEDTVDPDDLKTPEWRVFSNPGMASESRTFKLREVPPPEAFAEVFERIVLVEKLREVRALVGFTRRQSPRDFDTVAELPPEKRAALTRRDPTWVPASETRGEGIFFQFSERFVRSWTAANGRYDALFERGHRAWRVARNLDPDVGYPGLRFVMLHTFSHGLVRQLAVECGYTAASITERIYSRDPAEGDPMAGVLIYTSAPDSEGTLGGLCALGAPEKLGRHIQRALERTALCASDPLCSEHRVEDGETLHGAACHACTFLPETSCERGNRYLDRASVVETLEGEGRAFFTWTPFAKG